MHIVVTGTNDTTDATAEAIKQMQGGSVQLVEAAAVADVLAACKAAAGGTKVERIELVGHAGPGHLRLGDDKPAKISLESDDILNLAKLVQVLDGASGELWLAGCSTALHGEDVKLDGPVLLAWLAHAMPGIRIVGTRGDITANMFDKDAGLNIEAEFLYSLEHGEKLETLPESKSPSQPMPPAVSPITAQWRVAAHNVAPAPSMLDEWLDRAAEGDCRDARLLMASDQEIFSFEFDGKIWRVGVTHAGLRLMIKNDQGERFLFPNVRVPADVLRTSGT
jgi:hypothetical protein